MSESSSLLGTIRFSLAASLPCEMVIDNFCVGPLCFVLTSFAYGAHIQLNKGAGCDSVLDGDDIMLVIDIGSSSVRCSSYSYTQTDFLPKPRLRFHPECSTQLKHFLVESTSPSGVFKVVNEAVEETIKKLSCHGARQVVGIGFASFAMSFVGFSSEGKCVTPLFTYVGDKRHPCYSSSHSSSTVDNTLYGEEFVQSCHSRTGCMGYHDSYFLPQWLRYMNPLCRCKEKHSDTEDIQVPSVAYWQTLSSYIIYWY